jgi:PKD repeat protein
MKIDLFFVRTFCLSTVLFLILLSPFDPLHAQSIFWSDNFDLPVGGVTFNNAGVGYSGSTATPGGGQNTAIFGITDGWVIGTTTSPAGICVGTGSKLYVKASSGGGSANSYESDIYTDKYDATPNISTVGVTGISFVYSWRCNGVSGSDYGLIGLSSDGGTTWTWLSTQYQGQSTCQSNDTIHVPASYNGITNFRIAFRFISNATSCSTCDPPFNVDNLELIGTTAAAAPPVASFSRNDSVGCAGSCFTFTDNSTNSPTSRVWTFTGGTPSTSTVTPVTVCYATAGSYAVKLVVTNSTGSDSVTKASSIVINAKPNAGADQSVTCVTLPGGSATMAGSGTGTWTALVGNPGTATITSASSPTTTITNYSVAGTYKFVFSNNGCSDTAAVVVTAKPNAGADQSVSCVTLPGGTATMTGSGSGTWTPLFNNPGTSTITSTTSATTTITTFSVAGTYKYIFTSGSCADTASVTVTAAAVAGPSQTLNCVSLPGGTATMAASGTGAWTAQGGNPGIATITTPSSATTTITGFSTAGTYNFIWTSGGCTSTTTVTVTTKPNAGSDQFVACFPTNSSATMAATGTGTWTVIAGNPGTANITTPSSPTTTITGFSAAGIYYFQWANGSCSDTAIVSVTTKPNAGPDQSVSCVVLPGGSATMAATGTGTWTALAGNPGTATITTASSATTTITAFSAAGTYNFVWTSGSCSDTAAILVTAKPNAGPDESVSCITIPGGSATMAASGTGAWTAWSGNPGTATITSATSPTTTITAFSAAGTYGFIWTSGGCADTSLVNVTTTPIASITQSGDSLIASPAGASYEWLRNNALIAGATSQVYIATVTGAYKVVVSEGSCSDTSSVLNFKPTGIDNIGDANVTIWPNPFNDHIEISLGNMNSASIEIYSVLGTKIVSGTYHNQASIDMSTVVSGVYIVHIKNEQIDTTRMITKQ